MERLQALRGVGLTATVTFMVKVGDVHGFGTPRRLMYAASGRTGHGGGASGRVLAENARRPKRQRLTHIRIF